MASDEAEIDVEQLIMAAIADIEAPHLALLDLMVDWRPPRVVGEQGAMKLDIADNSNVEPWMQGWRTWTVPEIQRYRPRFSTVLNGLLGTLERHGLVFFDFDAVSSLRQMEDSFTSDVRRLEEQQRTGRSRPAPVRRGVRPPIGRWKATELGELVWRRFHSAGVVAPDAWSSAGAAAESTDQGAQGVDGTP